MQKEISHVVSLVHGTFGSNSGWTRDGSTLRTLLKDRFGDAIKIYGFAWSGANTHSARSASSQELRRHLTELVKLYPNAGHFVIGHSHGGNIALYATGDDELDGRLRGIICLNTPFVCATRRSHNQILFFLLHALAVLLIFLGLGQPAIAIVPLIRGGGVAARELVIALPFGIACLLSAWLLLRWREGLANWIVRRQGALIASVKLPTIHNTRVHCLWGPSDEVIGTFSLLDGLSALPYILMHPFALMLLFGASFLLFGVYPETALAWFGPKRLIGPADLYESIARGIIFFVAFAGDALTGGGGRYTGGWLFFGGGLATLSVVLVILAALAVALVAQTLLRLLPMGIVWYRFFDSLFVHLSFTQTPVSAEQVEFQDIGTSVSVLMHSAIYNDVRALTRLVDILQAERRPITEGPHA